MECSPDLGGQFAHWQLCTTGSCHSWNVLSPGLHSSQSHHTPLLQQSPLSLLRGSSIYPGASRRGPAVWTRGSGPSRSCLAGCDGGPLAAASRVTTGDGARLVAVVDPPLPHTCPVASAMRDVDQESWPPVPPAVGCRERELPTGGRAR